MNGDAYEINGLGETLDESYEEFHRVSEKSGRVFGYVFGFRSIVSGGHGVYAWCQYSVEIHHGFRDFGRRMPSQKFTSINEARAWFRKTMAERVEISRAKWLRDGHKIDAQKTTPKNRWKVLIDYVVELTRDSTGEVVQSINCGNDRLKAEKIENEIAATMNDLEYSIEVRKVRIG